MRKIKLFGINTKEPRAQTYNLGDTALLQALGIDPNTPQGELGEATYFTCLKTLSEIMGKLDIKKYTYDAIKGKERVYDADLDYIFNVEPNPYCTASSFKQAVELNRLHHGNAYVYVERNSIGKNGGKPKGLWGLPSEQVTIWMDDGGLFGKDNALWYVWQDAKSGKQYRFSMGEVLHFKSSITFDGIVGKSVREVLGTLIDTSQSSQNYLNKLYKGGMQSGKVLLYHTADISEKAENALVSSIERFASSGNTGAFIPLQSGITAETLENKLVDAEFSVLKKATTLQIAAAFGISPNFLNDFSKSSYANSVTQQQSLFSNTMMPIFKSYEEEYRRKILPSSEKKTHILEIDTKALFKLNPIEQAEVLQKRMQNFMITPNQAAEELGLPYIDDPKANELMGNGNMVNLRDVGNQYKKGGME